MEVVVAFVAGGLAGAALWKLMAPTFGADVFTRQNFRDRDLPTGAGMIVVLVMLAGSALAMVWETAGDDKDFTRLMSGIHVATVAAVAFGLLGMLDDLGGVGQSGGFRGHLRFLARGQLTTGAVKLFGGAAAGIVVSGLWYGPNLSVARLVLDGALVALSANLGNLFDRAPGRATKVALVAGLVLAVGYGFDESLAGVALALGTGAGLLWPDLRERLMLGDTGANVLGAVLGLGVVMNGTTLTRTVVLLVVAALNLASEKVSFSKVINNTGPLRTLDQLGREP